MWYDCQIDQLTQKLFTICHCTAFNNEQIPYRNVSYNRPWDKVCYRPEHECNIYICTWSKQQPIKQYNKQNQKQS